MMKVWLHLPLKSTQHLSVSDLVLGGHNIFPLLKGKFSVWGALFIPLLRENVGGHYFFP